METAAASHSLLETQSEVNIDGVPMKVYSNNKYHFTGCGFCVIGHVYLFLKLDFFVFMLLLV